MRKNVFEERYNAGYKVGYKLGYHKAIKETKKDAAKSLLENGTNPKEVSKITKLSLNTIQDL
ncbi:MAG: hypothetical protein HUK28_02405 [Methanobrevibacter sp.]|nr:hypothetical protein [Methanobrevibacter sp.]